MPRNDMPLPKQVGPKDMTYATYQHIDNLYKRVLQLYIMAVIALVVGCGALVIAVGLYLGEW